MVWLHRRRPIAVKVRNNEGINVDGHAKWREMPKLTWHVGEKSKRFEFITFNLTKRTGLKRAQ